MNRLTYLKKGKNLLRSIKAQREYLMKHQKGYVPTEFARCELANIDYALTTIVSYDQMRLYLERKEAELRIMLPANNRKKHRELQELIEINL